MLNALILVKISFFRTVIDLDMAMPEGYDGMRTGDESKEQMILMNTSVPVLILSKIFLMIMKLGLIITNYLKMKTNEDVQEFMQPLLEQMNG